MRTNPSVSRPSDAAAWERDAARDALALLGVGGYPRRAEYDASVTASVRAVCEAAGRSPCPAEQRDALWALADESAHAGDFVRLFPPGTQAEADVVAPLAAQALRSALGNVSAALALRL